MSKRDCSIKKSDLYSERFRDDRNVFDDKNHWVMNYIKHEIQFTILPYQEDGFKLYNL